MILAVAGLVLVGGWAAWCASVARRDGPGPAALTAVPLVVFVVLVVQAGAGLWDYADPSPAAVAVVAAAGLVATAAVAGLAAWVRRADPTDARSNGLLVGTAVAVAVWSGSCTAVLAV